MAISDATSLGTKKKRAAQAEKVMAFIFISLQRKQIPGHGKHETINKWRRHEIDDGIGRRLWIS